MATWGGYDGTILATRFQKTFIKDYLDLSGRLDVRNYDVSFNNRLFVMNDASFVGNIYVAGNLIANVFVANNDVSLNNRLFVLNDASFGNIYVDDIVTANLKLVSNDDVSLNSNVLVGKDISCNGNVRINRNLTVSGNLSVQNYTSQNIINTTTTNYQLVVSEDLSLNGRLLVSSDSSMNDKLFVSKDISLNGNIRYSSFLKDIIVDEVNIGSGKSIYDTVLGYQALASVPSASIEEKNTAIGFQSLLRNETGSHNTALGFRSLYRVVNSNYNTAVGVEALFNIIASDNNTAIGRQTGLTNTTGSSNTYIGYQANASANNFSNSTAIGYQSSITGNNQIVLGRTADTVVITRPERHLAQPIIIRKATSTDTQNIIANSNVIIKFPTSVYDNGYTGLGYDNTTGYFTNNNAYPISVLIAASVNLPGNATGTRATFIETLNNTTYVGIATEFKLVMNYQNAVSNTLSQHISTTVPLQAGASVYIKLYQTSGSTITINSTDTTNYPTIISIRVF